MIRGIGLAIVALLIIGSVARAQPAMVLVESLSAPVAGATEMDYVAPGTAIDLGKATVAVLDHLDSCTRETATGGVLHVGEILSKIDHGTIARDQFECDGRQLQLNAAMAQGGGQVYRALGHLVELHPMVVYSTAPIILARPDGILRVQRIDQAAPPIELPVPPSPDDKRVAIDMARLHQELVRGGSYRLSEGRWSLTFSIDPKAAGPDAPIVSRLLMI